MQVLYDITNSRLTGHDGVLIGGSTVIIPLQLL